MTLSEAEHWSSTETGGVYRTAPKYNEFLRIGWRLNYHGVSVPRLTTLFRVVACPLLGKVLVESSPNITALIVSCSVSWVIADLDKEHQRLSMSRFWRPKKGKPKPDYCGFCRHVIVKDATHSGVFYSVAPMESSEGQKIHTVRGSQSCLTRQREGHRNSRHGVIPMQKCDWLQTVLHRAFKNRERFVTMATDYIWC